MSRPPSSLLSVDDALSRITADIAPLPAEAVSLEAAHRRVLAASVSSRITQPPFDASAMDGFAVRAADISSVPCDLKLIGESAAGRPFEGEIAAGETVRIFTGGSVPESADAIVIQEDTDIDGNRITIKEPAEEGAFVRPRGFDFSAGDELLSQGRRLSARDLALAASMNVPELDVRRKPVVAILATGDELVVPGETPATGQIVSSSPFALAAMIELAGGTAKNLGIAKDSIASLLEKIDQAKDADVLLTIGGASVGEHDLVQEALRKAGMNLDFWKIAMRPGKPLMFGRLEHQRVIGVPGNPVSAIVCARIFLVPMLERLLGLEAAPSRAQSGILGSDVEANGPRQHYMRATLQAAQDALPEVRLVRSQDSSLQSLLAEADCLVVREPHAPAAKTGDTVSYLPLDF